MLQPLRALSHASSARSLVVGLRTTIACSSAGRCGLGKFRSKWHEINGRLFTSQSLHRQNVVANVVPPTQGGEAYHPALSPTETAKDLPLTCLGCGAPSQTVDSEAPGFYGSKRAAKETERRRVTQEEDDVFQKALKFAVLPDLVPNQGAEKGGYVPDRRTICDRCHYLMYQSRGIGIIHPSMQSLQQIIEESPHRHNHIYHVVDAADFPMSLIPNLQTALRLPRLRTQNRRSKTIQYIRGRMAEVSFIITRSDLLAPKKEQVDSLVPYLREVLREALGRNARNIRLGNVRCVSAQRGWWTRTVKEDIWRRGGAGWMVGKVNVGKSALYEVVFPKGRSQVDTDVNRMRAAEKRVIQSSVPSLEPLPQDVAPLSNEQAKTNTFYSPLGSADEELNDLMDQHLSMQETEIENVTIEEEEDNGQVFDESEEASLLPPAQPETAFPIMPLVSALPGTTASPIRIPFGNGKGELIDLPGIHRTSLDAWIKPEHHKSLVMKSRLAPEQITIKPGQSLLIGGVIRITPKTEELVFLAYPFVPLKAHVTSHVKAMSVQTGVAEDGLPYTSNVENISTSAAKSSIRSAGTFQLEWDVTKRRTGSLTDKSAGKVKTAELPFKVYSADILVESVGWIELTCQVRVTSPVIPEVEVFTPQGKFVAVRRPMNAWVLGGPNKLAKHRRRLRPRQTISMARRKAGGALGGRKIPLDLE